MTPIASARAFRKPAPFVPANLTFQDPAEVNAPPATERTGLLLNGKYAITLADSTPSPVTACGSNDPALSPCDAATAVEYTTTDYRKSARPVSRYDEWLLKAQAHQVDCWLGNLHLRYENYILAQRDPSVDLGLVRQRMSDTTSANRDPVKARDKPATSSETKKARGRPKKVTVNRLKPYLQSFIYPRDALYALPMFDDIVKGAVVADAGQNTRPFPKTRMVAFLQSLDVISAEAIQEEMNCSLRHAQKVAMCLRIIERHAFDIAEDQWHFPTETDWAGID